MHWRRVTREEGVGPYAELWNLEYPDDKRSKNEVDGMYAGMTPGSFEEHWIADEDALTCVLPAYDIRGTDPVENLSVEVVVHPDRESLFQGAFDFAEEIWKRSGAKSISVWSSDRHSSRNEDLEDRGFKLIQKVPMTRLDLSTFDSAPFREKKGQVEQQGIRLTTVQHIEDEGFDWIPKLHEAAWEMVQDMPQSHDPVQPPIEHYRQMLENRFVYDRTLMFVALHKDRIVAYSRVTAGEAMPKIARTGLSGVVRDHRRQGIITALKVMQAETLKAKGFKQIQTDNDVRNPMYQLNLALGFKDLWNWLQFEKK